MKIAKIAPSASIVYQFLVFFLQSHELFLDAQASLAPTQVSLSEVHTLNFHSISVSGCST